MSMELKLTTLENSADIENWQKAQVKLPQFDIQKMRDNTKTSPEWVHFGAGNIFRGFVAVLAQNLLNEKEMQTGIVSVETFDHDIIDRVYDDFDNLTMNVVLNSDATVDCEIIASVAEALKGGGADAEDDKRLVEIFQSPTLKIVSFTITEKGYALKTPEQEYLPVVESDIKNGPDNCRHVMSIVTACLYKRYLAGKHPIAMVSMDNCAKNGTMLKVSVSTIAREWAEKGFVDTGFIDYVSDEKLVSFPWSMIDKITPRPAKEVEEILNKRGIENMSAFVTSKGTFIAPFVNAERAQYLVIEDKFAGGRPALDKVGVYITDGDTVNKTERMKVTTCLNPLHTAMSVIGCLLGYTSIHAEMKDDDIVAMIKRLGYVEGLPVVDDPGILSPMAFIDEVINERLPNTFVPDAPQRIATDTSQKVGVRFGITIKSYLNTNRSLSGLMAIPLAIAGWMRYLLAVDDEGNSIEVSSDPLKDMLQKALETVVWNNPDSYNGQLRPILSNTAIFGVDLTDTVLLEKIENMFVSMLAGKGAVRKTLHESIA